VTVDETLLAARRRFGTVLRLCLLVTAAVVFLVPFYLLVRDGLATDAEITAPGWAPFPAPHWANLTELFTDPMVPMARALANSTLIAVLTTAGTLVLAAPAGYGLARLRYPYADQVFYLIVGSLMIPSAVTFVPSFVLVAWLGWVSTLRGLIVPTLFSGFAVLLFRQYFLAFPRELEDAAALDGLGYPGTFWHIVVPNSRPVFAAVGVIVFVGAWNSFLWPLVIGQDQDAWTVQVALSSLVTAQSVHLHELFAAAAVSIAPLVVVFLVLQRQLVTSVERSGLVG
jgi:multiple sugar transport system permease protein